MGFPAKKTLMRMVPLYQKQCGVTSTAAGAPLLDICAQQSRISNPWKESVAVGLERRRTALREGLSKVQFTNLFHSEKPFTLSLKIWTESVPSWKMQLLTSTPP